MNIRLIINTLFLTILLIFSSCSDKKKSIETTKKDLIIAIDSLTLSTVNKIVTNKFNTKSLIKTNQNFHSFKATQENLNELNKAKIIFYNSLMLNADLKEIINKLKLSGKNVFAIDNAFPKNSLIEINKNSFDSHFWMDPYLWRDTINFIENKLVGIYPGFESHLRSNAKNYINEIDNLIKYINEKITEIPAKNRIVISDHDNLSYFARRFNFQTKSILNNNLNENLSLIEISDYIMSKKAPAIFTEKSLALTRIKNLSDMLKGKGYKLKFCGALITDSVGGKEEELGDYILTYKHNILKISSALK